MLGRHYGTPLLPVTTTVVPNLAKALTQYVQIAAILFGAELVWRERQARISEIVDATSTSNFVFLAAKLFALAAALAAILSIGMVTGIAFQLLRGITQIEIGSYVVTLFLLVGSSALMVGVLSAFVQTIMPNKYAGLIVTFAVALEAPIAAQWLGYEHHLILFAQYPAVPLSDLNGYGHFLAAALWHLAYWCCVAILLVVATYLLWCRGVAPLMGRLRAGYRLATPMLAAVAVMTLMAGSAVGGYILWNSESLDAASATKNLERRRVAYEKAYRQFDTQPQPRITAVDMAVDLIPENRKYTSRGIYVLTNSNAVPVESVRVQFDFDVKVEKVELAEAELLEHEPSLNHFVFRPHQPLAPGATQSLNFVISSKSRSFESSDAPSFVVHNGTFLNTFELAPTIGISRNIYLKESDRRRAHGLDALTTVPAKNDKSELKRNYIRGDSDFVRFAITVSTSVDQTAIAPGELRREWTEGNRRFFRYEADPPILNFWSVVSARYEIVRDRWNDVDIVVYHHPGHDTNVPRMIEAIKASLAYFSGNFGPYQHRHLRIVEFPGYADFAQSFPGTIPYSESFGFLVDNRSPEDIDYVWSVTAHEVAHQWWAHQVVAANAPGATLLSETLAEYSALMVLEQRYGAEMMRKYLKYEQDEYLQSRAKDPFGERPLAHVLPMQQHIHYKKGSVAMYALKDAIGTEAINRALAKFVRDHANRTDPYPTSATLIRLLRAAAGRQHQQLVGDLLERIILWDLAVTKVTATQGDDAKWRVRIAIRAQKLEADGKGQEKQVPLDQAIEIGLFAADPDGASFSAADVIRLEKRRIKSGTQTVEFVSDRKPAFVGVNPYLKLIERDMSNNIVAVGDKAP
jgi:hypothetical protein